MSPTRTLIAALALAASTGASARIIDGVDVDAGEYREVYAILHFQGKPELCTATLVHPKILLTAAHCLPKPGSEGTAPVEVFATNSLRADFTDRPIVARTVHRHPLYDSTADELKKTAFDVGIVVLDQAVADPAVAPVRALDLEKDLDALLAEESLSVVGYGGKRNVSVDCTSGVKREGRTSASEVTDRLLALRGPRGGVALGDSGAPVFLGQGASRALVAVASAASSDGVRDGLPASSLAAAIRPELVEWIENKSGLALAKEPTPRRRAGFGDL